MPAALGSSRAVQNRSGQAAVFVATEGNEMTGEPKQREPDELSVPEKILRVQDLWDDIARSSPEVELTPAQREEAERRLHQHEGNPGKYPTWDEVKGRLEGER
jgi:putative addiction module component (TIGR02574 family)